MPDLHGRAARQGVGANQCERHRAVVLWRPCKRFRIAQEL